MEQNDSTSLVAASQSFVCATEGDAKAGQALIESIKALIKQVKDHHRPAIEAAHQAHKQALAAEKRVVEPLDNAVSFVKRSIDTFIREQREAARKQALEEQQRREAEARAAAEAAAREQARIRQEQQAALMAASPDVPIPILPPPAPVAVLAEVPDAPPQVALPDFKALGVKTRVEWRWEVVSIRSLCRAVADRTVSPEAIQVNAVYINKEVARLKESGVYTFPGIRVYEQEVSR